MTSTVETARFVFENAFIYHVFIFDHIWITYLCFLIWSNIDLKPPSCLHVVLTKIESSLESQDYVHSKAIKQCKIVLIIILTSLLLQVSLFVFTLPFFFFHSLLSYCHRNLPLPISHQNIFLAVQRALSPPFLFDLMLHKRSECSYSISSSCLHQGQESSWHRLECNIHTLYYIVLFIHNFKAFNVKYLLDIYLTATKRRWLEVIREKNLPICIFF